MSQLTSSTSPVKSTGHLAFIGTREYFRVEGFAMAEIRSADASDEVQANGRRHGRFECWPPRWEEFRAQLVATFGEPDPIETPPPISGGSPMAESFTLACSAPSDPVDSLPWRVRPIARFLRKPVWTWDELTKVERIAERLDPGYDCYVDDATDEESSILDQLATMAKGFKASSKAPWDPVMPWEPTPRNIHELAPVRKAKPVKAKAPSKPTRSADDIIMDGITSYRYNGLPSAYAVWETMAESDRRRVNARLLTLTGFKVSRRLPAESRFQQFVYDCANGSPVAFTPPEGSFGTDSPSDVADITMGMPDAFPDVPPVGMPSLLWDAIARYRFEGRKGVDWVGFQARAEDREAIDSYLVATRHPSAYEAGSLSDRFHRVARECAEGCPVSFPGPSAPSEPTIDVTVADLAENGFRLRKARPFGFFRCDVMPEAVDRAARNLSVAVADRMPKSHLEPHPFPWLSVHNLTRMVQEQVKGTSYYVALIAVNDHFPMLFAPDDLIRDEPPSGKIPVAPISGGSPVATLDPSTLTADEVIGSIGTIDVEWRDLMRDALDLRSELIDREVRARLDRAELMSIEADIRSAVMGVIESYHISGDVEWSVRRGSDAFNRLSDREQEDFARWLEWIGYRPGFAEYGRLATDESWDAMMMECIKGAELWFPIPLPDPSDPDGGDPCDNPRKNEAGPGAAPTVTAPPERTPCPMDGNSSGNPPSAPSAWHGSDTMGESPSSRKEPTPKDDPTRETPGGSDLLPRLPDPDGDDHERPEREDRAMGRDCPAKVHDPLVRHHDGAHGDQGARADADGESPRLLVEMADGGPARDHGHPGIQPDHRHGAAPLTDRPPAFRQADADCRYRARWDREGEPGFSGPGGEPGFLGANPEKTADTIRIGAREYGLSVIPGGYALDKEYGVSYSVTVGENGHECDCPSFEHRCKGLHGAACKHVSGLRDAGLIPPAPYAQEINPMPDLEAYGIMPVCGGAPEPPPSNTEIRAEFLSVHAKAEAAGVDPATLDRIRLACEFLTNPEFKAALSDHVWAINQKADGAPDHPEETAMPTIIEKAEALGGMSADAYWDEFETSPREDGPEGVGDWDSSAWGIAWKELKDEGATDADYEPCLDAWRVGFWA